MNVGQTVTLLTAGIGTLGTLSGAVVSTKLPKETEVNIGKVIIALGVISIGAGIAVYFLTKK